jgi:hypothetical protein
MFECKQARQHDAHAGEAQSVAIKRGVCAMMNVSQERIA